MKIKNKSNKQIRKELNLIETLSIMFGRPRCQIVSLGNTYGLEKVKDVLTFPELYN